MTALAAARSLIAYVLILAYIAVAAPLALLLGVVVRWRSAMWGLGHFGAKLALALAGSPMSSRPSLSTTSSVSE